jgi:hypothetical protein
MAWAVVASEQVRPVGSALPNMRIEVTPLVASPVRHEFQLTHWGDVEGSVPAVNDSAYVSQPGVPPEPQKSTLMVCVGAPHVAVFMPPQLLLLMQGRAM